MLERLIQSALERALTKAVSRQVDRAVTGGLARANDEQDRAEAFLSGWYAGLHLTYAGGFLVGALLLCAAMGLLLGEPETLAYFLPVIALMLALIFWARSRMCRVLFWPSALVLENRKGETAAEFSFSQTERISAGKEKLVFLVEGKRYTITCRPQENQAAFHRLTAMLRQNYPEKIQ